MRYVLCLLVVLGCGSKAHDGYSSSRIKEFRQTKDQSFIQEAWSPLTVEDRVGFKGLRYFPASAAWLVKAQFVPSEHIDTVLMSTSTDELRTATRPGKLVFTIQGKQYELWAFRFVEPGSAADLFVPFRDETNGLESYELGRYVEVQSSRTGDYAIDFNMAYNPFCAYNYEYSCPLVPYYNTLTIPITAGEKSWH